MNEDELFFDQMKDQFVTFYILTVLGMELAKLMQKNIAKKQQEAASKKQHPKAETRSMK